MSKIIEHNNYSRLFKKIVIFLIFLLFIALFFKSIDFTIEADSLGTLKWGVTLNFNETGGKTDNIIFGEANDARDGSPPDDYDEPKPPSPPESYIDTWFDADLENPYNKLLKDIRKYPDNYKIWNFYVKWIPSDYISPTEITISWNNSNLYNSEYYFIVLHDNFNNIDVDMIITKSYNFNSLANNTHHFQVICSSNNPNPPSNPFPNNGSANVDINANLGWVCSDPNGDPLTYDVYFGTNSNPPLIESNWSSTSYEPGTMSYSTIYYWKIVACDNNGNCTNGPIWHFKTEIKTSPPSPGNNPPFADANGPYQGYMNQTITFDASKSYDTDGIIEYYRWDFTSDNKWDTEWIEQKTITYVYSSAGNYTVILEVKDNQGATDIDKSLVKILHINESMLPPIAKANGPYVGLIKQNITFYANGSYDEDGIITKYIWDFGDGTTNTIKNPIHAYTINGTYIVTLEVIDNHGLIDKDETKAYIFTADSDKDGWGDEEEIKYGTNPNDPLDFPIDTDNDHIPDSEDYDDDNDGLINIIEEKLGSDPKNKSDVKIIKINGITHFLLDTDRDSKINLFYNSTSGKATTVYYINDNRYLIDEDGDGEWDYIYDPAGTLSKYSKEETNPVLELPFVIYLISIIFVLLIIIIILKFLYTKKS